MALVARRMSSAVVDRAAQPDTASPALAARSSGLAAAAAPKIAYIREPAGGYAGVLWVMNPDGSGQRRLGPAFPDMDWSPDGQKIVFTTWGDRRPSGGGDIYVMNADGSGRERLTTNPGPDSDPAWSPDGRKIAFVSGRDGNSGIYVMNADGTQQRLLMRAKVSYPPQLVWSPDGQKLAFTVALTSGPDGNLEIYVMNADGSGLRNLTRSTVRDSYPVWSPDGRRIAFESDWQVNVMNADGSPAPRRLTHNGGRNFNPTWSPDGQRIAFEHRRRQGTSHWVGAWGYKVYVMNADGSGQRRLTHGGSQPRWSPDGRQDRVRQQARRLPRHLRHERQREQTAEPDANARRGSSRKPACLVTRAVGSPIGKGSKSRRVERRAAVRLQPRSPARTTTVRALLAIRWIDAKRKIQWAVKGSNLRPWD